MAGKWNESGLRPLLFSYRLNWARRTFRGWSDEWDDSALQTQDSNFKPWRSEAEHATSRSWRLQTIRVGTSFTSGWGRNIVVSFKPPRPGNEPRTLAWKAAVLATYPRAPALLWLESGWCFRWWSGCNIHNGEHGSHGLLCPAFDGSIPFNVEEALVSWLTLDIQTPRLAYMWEQS